MPFMTAPFGKIIKKRKFDLDTQLDAIYIPTLANRAEPVCDLDYLLSFSKKIIFLFSDEIAQWCIRGVDRIQFESMKSQENFLKEYFFRKGNINPSTEYRTNFDIPLKRSFALHDAKINNYSRILLLDDDIFVTGDNLETGLTGLLEGATIVGFHVVDYPDVSTVDHIRRLVTNSESTISMTGSCMFINVEKVRGDFPNVYNEDLFFFMQQDSADSVVSGGHIYQKPYEPWLSLERIKHEQFGDLIYDAIKKRFLCLEFDIINWTDEIADRKVQIQELQKKASSEKMGMVLEAALEALNNLDVRDIVDFIEANNFPEWITKYL